MFVFDLPLGEESIKQIINGSILMFVLLLMSQILNISIINKYFTFCHHCRNEKRIE